jgi:hypothetical protein
MTLQSPEGAGCLKQVRQLAKPKASGQLHEYLPGGDPEMNLASRPSGSRRNVEDVFHCGVNALPS